MVFVAHNVFGTKKLVRVIRANSHRNKIPYVFLSALIFQKRTRNIGQLRINVLQHFSVFFSMVFIFKPKMKHPEVNTDVLKQ